MMGELGGCVLLARDGLDYAPLRSLPPDLENATYFMGMDCIVTSPGFMMSQRPPRSSGQSNRINAQSREPPPNPKD